MIRKLKINLKQVLKYVWIGTNISLLQFVLVTCVLYPDYSFTNSKTVLCLVLLSFPCSIPAVLLAASFMQGYPPVVSPPFDYIIISVVAFISGYIQWFWCIPRMLKEPEITSLHLTSHDKETHIPAAMPTRRRQSNQLKLARAPFDKTGHSPLERAIGIKRDQVHAYEVINACGRTSQSSTRQSPSMAFHQSCNDRRKARRRRAADRIAASQR